MNTEKHQIHVSGLTVDVVRKAIKNLHLGVYPPDGRVRVAVPLAVSDEAVRLAVIGKLGWIKRQRKRLRRAGTPVRTGDGQRREPLFPRAALSASRHTSTTGQPGCVLRNKASIDLYVRPGTTRRTTRASLAALVSRSTEDPDPAAPGEMAARSRRPGRRLGHQEDENQVGKLQRGVPAASGSTWNWPRSRCSAWNTSPSTSWFISWSGHHNDRFTALMDRFLPQWRSCRDELNRAPLAHETWNY